jgi:hypothetical protein
MSSWVAAGAGAKARAGSSIKICKDLEYYPIFPIPAMP